MRTEPTYNASLLEHNTFGIKAKARMFCSYDSEASLRDVLGFIRRHHPELPLLHIGCGSNLLFLGDYPGIVLKSAIRGIRLLEEDDSHVLVEAGAGEVCDDFIAYALQQGWYGMENLSLIPGQVGAAAVQNIGAYGVEVCDVIHEVRGISLQDGSERVWKQAECGYGYRQSIFKTTLWGKYAITRVTFRLGKHFEPKLQYGGLVKALGQAQPSSSQNEGPQPSLPEGKEGALRLRQAIIGIRREKLPDPAVQGNAGSFFKNPVVPQQQAERLLSLHPDMPHYAAGEGCVKLAAGWLIEQAGWKGRSLGAAAVHDRQALVLVNKGGATGQDIQRLCEAIQKDVAERFGIELEPEVNMIR